MFLPMSHMAQEMQKNQVGMTMIRVQRMVTIFWTQSTLPLDHFW